MNRVSFLFLCLVTFVKPSSANPKQLGMFTSKILPEGYNEDEPPDGGGDNPKVLDLEVELKVLGFNDFQEALNSLKMSIVLNSFWIESRVNTEAFKDMEANLFIPRDEQKFFWKPYFMFYEIKGGDLLDNQLKYPWYMINSTTKRVQFRQYFDLNVECKMQMQNYPLDVQKCTLDLRTFQPEEFGKWINIKWKEEERREEWRPIPVFSFSLVRIEKTVVMNVTRPLLRLTFLFDRQVLPQLVTLYMPSSLIVCCTFISFWIRTSAVPARVALIITAMLAMLQLMITGRRNLPPVSYVTALDIWLFLCVSFVFGALFEFAFAYNFDLQKKPDKKQLPVWSPSSSNPKTPWKSRLRDAVSSQHIDSWSRILFPLSFLVFIAGYFSIYLA